MSLGSKIVVALVVAAAGLVAGCASESAARSEEPAGPPDMDPAEMMRLYTEKNAKNEHHERFARMAGTWAVAGKSWMSPDQPPMESTGTATFTLQLDGRYLRQEYSSEFMGQPYRGIGLDGYDNARQQYFSIWTDSMSTGAMYSWGDYDATERRMTLQAEHLDVITGATETLRMTVEERSDDEFVFTMYMVVPGAGDVKHMELIYRRT